MRGWPCFEGVSRPMDTHVIYCPRLGINQHPRKQLQLWGSGGTFARKPGDIMIAN